MSNVAEWELEEARERNLWIQVRQVIWTILIVLGTVVFLCAMSALPGWRGFIVLGLLGVLAGLCIALAVGHAGPHRPLAGLVFGGITLPLLAAYLGTSAARDPNEFRFTSTGLMAFFAYGAAAFFAVLWITTIWRRTPNRGGPENAGAEDFPPHEGAAP
jgi:hypothetical protein